MAKKQKNNNIVLYALFAVLGFSGLWYYLKNKNNTTATTNSLPQNTTTEKAEWYQYAHPAKTFEQITNEELAELFKHIIIPTAGYTTKNGSEYVESDATVHHIIYLKTGEVITDIDNNFFNKLINNADSIGYGFSDANGKKIDGIKEITKA